MRNFAVNVTTSGRLNDKLSHSYVCYPVIYKMFSCRINKNYNKAYIVNADSLKLDLIEAHSCVGSIQTGH